jgi:hypothetical protein
LIDLFSPIEELAIPLSLLAAALALPRIGRECFTQESGIRIDSVPQLWPRCLAPVVLGVAIHRLTRRGGTGRICDGFIVPYQDLWFSSSYGPDEVLLAVCFVLVSGAFLLSVIGATVVVLRPRLASAVLSILLLASLLDLSVYTAWYYRYHMGRLILRGLAQDVVNASLPSTLLVVGLLFAKARCSYWRTQDAVCSSCGYPRLGLTAERCPECGKPLTRYAHTVST